MDGAEEKGEEEAVGAEEHLYLLPVADLTLSREWSVGRVRFLPKGSTLRLIGQRRSEEERRPPDWYEKHLDENEAARFDDLTVALVACPEPREAYEQVADALTVLRLLQHMRAPMVDTDQQTFGLPGQVTLWHVDFIDLLAGPAAGFVRGGAIPGWTFSEEDHDAFQADIGLQFLSASLAKEDRTRLEQRGTLGARLLSTSTLEQDPDQKLLAAIMALEVLIGDDISGCLSSRRRRRNLAVGVASTRVRGRLCMLPPTITSLTKWGLKHRSSASP